jgi:hypothetical protein
VQIELTGGSVISAFEHWASHCSIRAFEKVTLSLLTTLR